MKAGRLVTRVRPDETLYSAIARIWNYLGSPASGLMHEALFAADLPTIDGDLPVGLEAIAFSSVLGTCDLDEAVHGWTLFPYYAHFVDPRHTRQAARAMAGRGEWPHGLLKSWSATVPPPDRLRFCLQCREEMLTEHHDLWWRRAHQLPSVLVCPDHERPLHVSDVTRAHRQAGYIPASLQNCPGSALWLARTAGARNLSDLAVIARMSDMLLDQETDQHPDEHREEYLRRLNMLSLLNRKGEADLGKVAKALDGYWGDSLDFWPGLRKDGRCEQRWLGALLWGEHRSPPLHHILLEGLLNASIRR